MKYLAMETASDQDQKALMLVEMRLADAPEKYIQGLSAKSTSHVRTHYVWWFELADDAWRDYVRKQFEAVT